MKLSEYFGFKKKGGGKLAKAKKVVKKTETEGPVCAKKLKGGGRCSKKRGHWGTGDHA